MIELPRTYSEPAMLLGSYESYVTQYEASEAGRLKASERLANELTKTAHASIITGELGVFQVAPFIRLLQNAVKAGRPSLDLIFYCRHLIQTTGDNGVTLKPDARELLIECLEEEWPAEGQDGIGPSDVRTAVQEALAIEVLRLYVVKQRVEDRPHSAILDNGNLAIQQVHRRGQYSKMWFVENPAGLILRYRTEHEELKSEAARLT